MQCNDVLPQLNALADGELDVWESPDLREHLGHCARSAQELIGIQVLAAHARQKLRGVLQVMGEDRRNCGRLQSDGGYARLAPGESAAADSPGMVGTFEALMRETVGG